MALYIEQENHTANDESNLAALRDGDPSVTEKFVREHAVWMLAVARRILHSNSQTEDIVQSAFASIFRNLKSFEGKSSLKTWMHRITINEALMALRKDRRAREVSIEDLQPVFENNGCRIEDRWATIETPEILVQKAQTRVKIIELIDLLPDEYRIVLVLRDIEELSTAEVAQALELSEANVKVRLHRARAALKKTVGTIDERTSTMTDAKTSMRRRLHGVVFKLPLMITCDEFEDFILAYLEDDLPRKQKLVFDMHLKLCRECRDYLKAYRASIDLAKNALRADSQQFSEDVPQDLVDAVLTARKA